MNKLMKILISCTMALTLLFGLDFNNIQSNSSNNTFLGASKVEAATTYPTKWYPLTSYNYTIPKRVEKGTTYSATVYAAYAAAAAGLGIAASARKTTGSIKTALTNLGLTQMAITGLATFGATLHASNYESSKYQYIDIVYYYRQVEPDSYNSTGNLNAVFEVRKIVSLYSNSSKSLDSLLSTDVKVQRQSTAIPLF